MLLQVQPVFKEAVDSFKLVTKGSEFVAPDEGFGLPQLKVPDVLPF